jgi:hypothetical protein
VKGGIQQATNAIFGTYGTRVPFNLAEHQNVLFSCLKIAADTFLCPVAGTFEQRQAIQYGSDLYDQNAIGIEISKPFENAGGQIHRGQLRRYMS